MKKSKIKGLVKSAIENINILNAYFCYDPYYYNLIPLISNNKLFLVINEDDFIFDGYSIYRFKDLIKVKIKNDLCDRILKEEGLTSTIIIPSVNIESWKSVFGSLKQLNHNIIVEKQSHKEADLEFVIGRIEKTYKSFALIWNFDANGVWGDNPIKVSYLEIISVRFGSRYVETYSKYIGEPPTEIS